MNVITNLEKATILPTLGLEKRNEVNEKKRKHMGEADKRLHGDLLYFCRMKQPQKETLKLIQSDVLVAKKESHALNLLLRHNMMMGSFRRLFPLINSQHTSMN